MTPGRAEIIAIGSELLEPWRLETNGAHLSRRLGEIGVPVRFRTIVGDEPADLKDAFRVALGRSDLVVATGGLGPTVDDLTREAVAELLGLPLIDDAGVAAGIEERFRRRGYAMPPSNRRQAQVPRGATVLRNALGTAPGLLLREQGKTIVLLPGVPSEMRRMFDEEALPQLGRAGERYVYRILKIAGLAESEVDHRLSEVWRQAGEVVWTILAAPGQVEIHLKERVVAGAEPRGIARLDAAAAAVLGPDLFARDDDTMEAVVGRLLLERGESVAIGESLTGGLIAARLTGPPGASRYVLGGVVSYTDAAKTQVLGVRPATLEAHGAVSAETALEMAAGARRLLGASWGASATGYAGPEAGGPQAPPGTVFIGVAGPVSTMTRSFNVPGDRDVVRTRAAQSALDLLRRALLGVIA
jgi:nicotinamide-nucleotide amidase